MFLKKLSLFYISLILTLIPLFICIKGFIDFGFNFLNSGKTLHVVSFIFLCIFLNFLLVLLGSVKYVSPAEKRNKGFALYFSAILSLVFGFISAINVVGETKNSQFVDLTFISIFGNITEYSISAFLIFAFFSFIFLIGYLADPNRFAVILEDYRNTLKQKNVKPKYIVKKTPYFVKQYSALPKHSKYIKEYLDFISKLLEKLDVEKDNELLIEFTKEQYNDNVRLLAFLKLDSKEEFCELLKNDYNNSVFHYDIIEKIDSEKHNDWLIEVIKERKNDLFLRSFTLSKFDVEKNQEIFIEINNTAVGVLYYYLKKLELNQRIEYMDKFNLLHFYSTKTESYRDRVEVNSNEDYDYIEEGYTTDGDVNNQIWDYYTVYYKYHDFTREVLDCYCPFSVFKHCSVNCLFK
jgi:hypothetical protein